MALEVGEIVQGTVVRLLQYGVLVRLDDGQTGLVHISEIDQNYVRDVADYFGAGDEVKVKILKIEEGGRRIELSAKQARAEGEAIVKRQRDPNDDAPPPPRLDPGARREARASFEEKMGDFMRSSNERLSDLKRNIESKRGGKRAR